MCVTVKLQAAQQGIDTASAQLRAAGVRGRVSIANVKDETLRAVAATVQRVERGGADEADAFEMKLAQKITVGPWKRGMRVASLDAALLLAAAEMKRADGKAGGKKDGALELKEQATLSPTTAQLLLFAMDILHAKNGVHDPNITLKMRMDKMLHGTPIPGQPVHGAAPHGAAPHGAAAAAHTSTVHAHASAKADDKLPEIHVHIDGAKLAHDVVVHVHVECGGLDHDDGHSHGAAVEPPKLAIVAPN